MIIQVPTTAKRSDGKTTPEQIRKQMALLQQKYGLEFEQACRLNNIPDYLLAATVLIENFGLQADSVNRAPGRPMHKEATGLGQHMMYSATDIISRAKRKRLLNDEKRAVLKRQLGSRLDYIERNAGTTEYVVKQADLKDPEFNLMLTGMYLSQLMAEHKEADHFRLDLVGLRYNQGYFFKLPTNRHNTDALVNNYEASFEGRKWVLRMCGAGGILDSLLAV